MGITGQEETEKGRWDRTRGDLHTTVKPSLLLRDIVTDREVY